MGLSALPLALGFVVRGQFDNPFSSQPAGGLLFFSVYHVPRPGDCSAHRLRVSLWLRGGGMVPGLLGNIFC